MKLNDGDIYTLKEAVKFAITSAIKKAEACDDYARSVLMIGDENAGNKYKELAKKYFSSATRYTELMEKIKDMSANDLK